MPAKSKKQQMAAGAALSAERGERPKSSLKGASKEMVESMSEKPARRLREHEAKESAENQKIEIEDQHAGIPAVMELPANSRLFPTI